MTDERAIHAAALAKVYGGRRVLEAVDFEVAPGEVVALVGENGTGKTTLIEIFMGLKAADGGEIRVLGTDPASRRHLGRVGWIPEHPTFPRRWRVREVLRFQSATQPGWDPALARDLGDRLAVDPERRAGELSRGERGRLALLLALAHRPAVLLLDDPILGLDAPTRRLVVGELLAAVAEEGAAVLLTTHQLAEMERALDRVLLLRGGRITLDRSMEDLRSDRGTGSAGEPVETLEDSLFAAGGRA